jgi:hypothetical protein
MDIKENIRKYWWVGAILLAVLFLLRPKQEQTTTSRMAAIEEQTPTGDGIMQETLSRLAGEEAARASRIADAQEALALQQLQMQKSLLGAESQLQLSILRGQQVVQDRLTDKASKIKFQCPPGQGVAKLDPSTGQIYCRAKAGGGGFKGLLNTVTGVANSIAPFFGAPSHPNLGQINKPRGGTPPIAPSTPPFFPSGGFYQ